MQAGTSYGSSISTRGEGSKGRTHIRFRWAQLELDQCNLGLFHSCRSVLTRDKVLFEHHAGDQLRVLDRAPDLLHNPNVAQVDVRGTCSGNARDGFDGDGGEDGRVLGNDFRIEAGGCRPQQRGVVF